MIWEIPIIQKILKLRDLLSGKCSLRNWGCNLLLIPQEEWKIRVLYYNRRLLDELKWLLEVSRSWKRWNYWGDICGHPSCLQEWIVWNRRTDTKFLRMLHQQRYYQLGQKETDCKIKKGLQNSRTLQRGNRLFKLLSYKYLLYFMKKEWSRGPSFKLRAWSQNTQRIVPRPWHLREWASQDWEIACHLWLHFFVCLFFCSFFSPYIFTSLKPEYP